MMKILWLDDLHVNVPAISARGAGLLIECCMYCMEAQGHESGVVTSLEILGETERCAVQWREDVTAEFSFRYGGNEERTTELGATALALSVVRDYTEFTAVREAFKGSRVDYFLCKQDVDEDTFIFECVDAYVEIRGIRKERKGNTIAGATNEKLRRLQLATGINLAFPTYVAVVEFGQPHVRIVQK